ncbi:MAG: hypothetical protein FWC36_09395 [Spirochaetes bacterium]|nr:hypothetical protein [Spirochaetota bacterium]
MRKFIFLLFFIIFCFNLFAKDAEIIEVAGVTRVAENTNPNAMEPKDARFVMGAGVTWTNNPKLLGGHLDFGITLHRNILYLRNNLMLRGGGMTVRGEDYTVLTISNKLILGRNTDIPLRIYTYLESGVGIYGNQTKNFFEAPYVITGGFGGGVEIFSKSLGGIYVEIGYIGQRVNLGYPVSGIIIQTGWRIFF